MLKLEKWPQKLYLIAKFHVNCMILKELVKVKKSLHGNSEELCKVKKSLHGNSEERWKTTTII